MDKVGVLWYNTGMSEKTKPEKLIVVEATDLCKCHEVVIARKRDEAHWVYLFVKSPRNIQFGDTLVGRIDSEGFFGENYWLEGRGTDLDVGLVLDDFPEEVINQLIAETPPCVDSGMFPETDYFPT
jgi:hypothetical protein